MTDRYPKPQQYGGLASELRQAVLDLLKTIAAVNESHSRLLHEAIDADLRQIGLMLDLATDLKYMTPDQRDALRIRIDEIGRRNLRTRSWRCRCSSQGVVCNVHDRVRAR